METVVHPSFALAVVTDELVCYRLGKVEDGELVEPDDVKVNDKGWRTYVYKRIADAICIHSDQGCWNGEAGEW